MSRITSIIIAVVACALVCLGWLASHYRNSAIEYQNQRDKATARADSSEAVTSNVITTLNIVHSISQAAQNAKQELAQQGETHVGNIQTALTGDGCADQPVPAAAADELRRYADSLRTSTSSTD
ncbi:lysozyme [Citrobacter amalonaticus]